MVFKTNLHNNFQMDTSKEEEGVWVDLGDGVRIKVRRFKSRKSQEIRQELDKPHSEQIRRKTMTQAASEDLLVQHMARGIISAWEGVTETLEDGTTVDVPYSGDKAYELLVALPELRDELFAVSIDRDSYKIKADDDAEKNS